MRRYVALAVIALLGGAGGALYLWGPFRDPRGRAGALCQEGEIALSQGDPDRALAAYRKAMEIDPQSAEALVGAGRIQFRRRRFGEAIAHLRRAAALSGTDARIWMDLGRALREAGASEEAAFACQRALELAPDRADVLAELGRSLFAQGRYEEAGQVYRRAEALKPDDPDVHAEMGRLYLRTGDADSASVALLRAAMLRPGDAGLLCDLGEVSLRGNPEEAVIYLQHALKTDPHLTRARYLLGRAYLRIGREEEGKRELAAFERQSRYAGRIEVLEKAVADRPTAELYQELSHIYAELGQDSLAAQYLMRATGLDPMKTAPQEVERAGRGRW